MVWQDGTPFTYEPWMDTDWIDVGIERLTTPYMQYHIDLGVRDLLVWAKRKFICQRECEPPIP